MEDGAKKAAEGGNIDLKLAAGKSDGDEDTQIQAIENAISKGDKGILMCFRESDGSFLWQMVRNKLEAGRQGPMSETLDVGEDAW